MARRMLMLMLEQTSASHQTPTQLAVSAGTFCGFIEQHYDHDMSVSGSKLSHRSNVL